MLETLRHPWAEAVSQPGHGPFTVVDAGTPLDLEVRDALGELVER